MNREKEKVLELARKKYRNTIQKKYGIDSIQGTCLIDALIELRNYSVSWSDAKYFLIYNFGMKNDDTNYSDEYNCKVFLKNFKFEQKTMKNE